MSLWASFVNWLGGASPDGRAAVYGGSDSAALAVASEETSTAVMDPEETWLAIEEDAPVEVVPGRNVLEWWRTEGPVVLEPPTFRRPELTGRAAETCEAVIKALDAALNNPNIELPHLPHVPQEALLLLRNERCGMREVAEVIAQDQVLAAELLRRANSVIFGGAVKVITLQGALTRLGARGIRSMLIAESLKQLTISTAEDDSRGLRLCREALAAAHVLSECAACFHLRLHEPFLVGLLHDIGKLVVLRACCEVERVQGAVITDGTFEYFCQEYHEMMGEMLVEHWRLPEQLGSVIRTHHQPLERNCGDVDARAAIQLTDAMVSLMGYGTPIPYDLLNTPGAVHLRAEENARFMELLPRLPEQVRQAVDEALRRAGAQEA